MFSTKMNLFRRYICDDNYPNDYNCNSSWNTWGRWVAAGVILAIGLIAFFLIAWLNARRRRRRGLHPIAGTAWMAPPAYTPGAEYQQPPPQYYNGPPQGPPPNSYYGGREPNNNNIELQQPGNAYYQGGDNVYQPPPGPPPNKPKF